MNHAHPKRGAALLYVMLIFASVSLIAVGLADMERLDIFRTARFLTITQARQYALGGELYARQILFADMRDNKIDHAREAWAKLKPDFSIDGGDIAIRTEDLRGLFNINSLLTGNPVAQARFIKLCSELKVDAAQAAAVLARLTPGHPPADAPKIDVSAAVIQPLAPGTGFADPSELLDAGLPFDAYEKLAPHLTALPDASMDINVNAASDEVLRAYLPNVSQAAAIRSAVASNGYMAPDQFGVLKINDPSLHASSEFFRVHVTVKLQGQVLHLKSTLMRRNNQDIVTIARVWGD